MFRDDRQRGHVYVPPSSTDVAIEAASELRDQANTLVLLIADIAAERERPSMSPRKYAILVEAERKAVQALSDELSWARGAPSKRTLWWRMLVREQIAGIRAMRQVLTSGSPRTTKDPA